MKIGINGRFLLKPFTGIGTYTQNLFFELAKIDQKNEYIFVVPSKVPTGIKRLMNCKNIKFKVLPEPKFGSGGIKKTWWEQISVPEFFEKEGVDVAIFPYACNPWTKDWYNKGIKTIVTVHDCIPWVNKKYRRGFTSKLYHLRSKNAVALADVVLTVSESSKKQITKVCGVKKSKIHVLYNGVSNCYLSNSTSKILNEFDLKPRGYLLYVGGYDVRKNVQYLALEYLKFNDKYEDIPLVMAGAGILSGKLYDSFEIDGKGIKKTGFLDEKDLAELYKNCLAFVNFSEEEGFNIPALEAATSGAPLILSNIPVHREIYDECALLVDTKKDGAGAAAFEKIVDKIEQKTLRQKSLKTAKNYSFKASAKKLLDTFKII